MRRQRVRLGLFVCKILVQLHQKALLAVLMKIAATRLRRPRRARPGEHVDVLGAQGEKKLISV
jgi:hypothetical protein